MSPTIGVLDSGVGGLTVLAALAERLPSVSTVYLGDTARNPYGEKTPAEITAMARDGLRFLRAAGATVVVVACNTITFAALPVLAREADFPCIGMPRDIAWPSDARHVAVAATSATIATHAHREAVRRTHPHLQVTETACEGLAAAIEQGDTAAAAARIQAAVRCWTDVDTVLWACTHYPLVADLWRAAMPSCRWLDPATAVADEVARRLTDVPTGRGTVRLCFTDERAAAGLRRTAYAAHPWEVVDISEKRGGR